MTSPETSPKIDNPFFAWFWPLFASHEAETVRVLRRENLAGLSGRVLEVGAGCGTNFPFYPDTVTEVVAVEPESRLWEKAQAAAAEAPVPITVTSEVAEEISDGEPFDAAVCSLVLCSVHDQGSVLRRVHEVLKPGGELRFLEHIASAGIRGRYQQFVDATIWPRIMGNCHTHRDTERAIRDAGFELEASRHEWTLPSWAPLPVSELAVGRARRV